MTERIGVDITANVSGFDKGADIVEKRVETMKRRLENDLGGAAKTAGDAMDGAMKKGKDAVDGLINGGLAEAPGHVRDLSEAAGLSVGRLALLAGVVGGVAVGVSALAVAAYQGAEESRAFANALIMSGNAAGSSTDALNGLAIAISATTGATRGQAAAVLTQLVATGKVAESSLDTAAAAALRLERTGVQAVEKTVAQFAELGKSPVEASLKLNEQYNFLTAEVYRQIKALQDEGREREAAALAMSTYANAADTMATAVDKNLGILERSWRAVKETAKGAWDAMLNIGREGTIDQQIAELQKQLAIAREAEANGTSRYLGRFGDTQELEARLNYLGGVKAAQEEATSAVRADNEARKAGIAFDQLKEQYLTKEQKLTRELIRIRNEGKAAGASESEIRQIEDAAREKYKERAPRAEKISDYDRLVRSIKEKIAVGELDAAQEEKLTESQRMQARVMSDLANGSIKLTATQRAHIELLLNEAIAIERKNQAEAAGKKADLIIDDYRRINGQMVERIAREAELATMTGDRRAVAEALYKVEDEGAKIRERILRDLPEGIAQTRALAEAEAELAIQKARVTSAAQENYEQQRTFEFGWDKAFRAYEESATNAAKTAETAFSGTTQAMEGAIKSFMRNGKGDFKSFGDAVINTLIEIQMQSIKTNVLAPLMSSAGNWLTSFFTPSNADTVIPLQPGGGYHSGGIAGLEPTFTRMVPAAAYRNAPRYHTGGISGDEEPAILKKGEGVFTEAQMRKLAPSNGGTVVNVINNAKNTETTQRRRQGSNGESIIDIVIDAVKNDLIGDIASGGAFASGLEGKYALNRSAGAWR